MWKGKEGRGREREQDGGELGGPLTEVALKMFSVEHPLKRVHFSASVLGFRVHSERFAW